MKTRVAPALLLALLLVGLASTPAQSQTVLRVWKQNPTPGDGSSWAAAYEHPNDALAAADAIAGPVEIWVTTATYLPAKGGTDPTISFALRGDLELLGGFVGNEGDRSERDPAAHPTILSGDIGLNFVVADDAYHVVRADSLSGPVVVDGFEITRGNASQTGGDGLGGGGVFVRASDLTLRRCVLQANRAGGSFPAFGDRGGAVHLEESGNLVVDRCEFLGNEAYVGAGIDVSSDSGDVEVSIVDSTFEQNRALDGLGAAINCSRGSLIVERTSFVANRARLAVAIQATLAREVVIRDCLFEDNRGQQRATVLLDRADDGGQIAAVVERSQFLDNTATNAFGSALAADGTLVEVHDCEFRGNTNVSISSVDGDFLGTGTVSAVGRIGHRFTNNLFADNFAGRRAGLILRSAPSLVVNSTFVNNHSASTDSVGVGVSTFVDGDLELRNVILWGNRYGTGENDDQPGVGGQPAQFMGSSNSALSLAYCDVEGWVGGESSDGTFGADPLFVNPALGDYRLQAGSPAIDAGDNAAVALVATDLDGQARITDGRFDGGMRVDLGPYEFAGAVVATPPAAGTGLAMRIANLPAEVRIDYRLPTAVRVRLNVFDLRGRRVRTLRSARQEGGDHQVVWDRRDHAGRGVASGVYLVRLVAAGRSANGKVLLLR